MLVRVKILKHHRMYSICHIEHDFSVMYGVGKYHQIAIDLWHCCKVFKGRDKLKWFATGCLYIAALNFLGLFPSKY